MSSIGKPLPNTSFANAYMEVKKTVDKLNSEITFHNIKTVVKIIALIASFFTMISLVSWQIPISNFYHVLSIATIYTISVIGYFYANKNIYDNSIKFFRKINEKLDAKLHNYSTDTIRALKIERVDLSPLFTIGKIKLDSYDSSLKRTSYFPRFLQPPYFSDKYYDGFVY
jgi:hypothetical protein